MNSIKKFTIASLVFLLVYSTKAQVSISNQLIGSTGTFGSVSTVSVSYSVGEVTIATSTAGSTLLTQGFQQSNPVGFGAIKSVSVSNFSLFPNPSKNWITIKNELDYTIKNIHIIDATGRIIKSIANYQNNDKIDLVDLAAGNYYLQIQFVENAIVKLNTFSLQKI